MKILDVVCSAGRTGFYFDDQRAIKKGAGHDGVFYTGEPVTEGFASVRQAGESISVMLVLEDGQIAYGDCAAVQYSGAGGRDPLFLAKDFIPLIDKYIKPELVGQEADSFRALAKKKIVRDEPVCRFEFAYAITCHKAQGSEFNYAVVFDESYVFGEERRRWLYTAVTRAKEKLIIVR